MRCTLRVPVTLINMCIVQRGSYVKITYSCYVFDVVCVCVCVCIGVCVLCVCVCTSTCITAVQYDSLALSPHIKKNRSILHI